ncbi:MAG: DNA polymerase [Chloroflexota bacterium]
MNRRLVLFDGNALVHRAYHALPPLTVRQTGEAAGAVYGFVLMLLKVLNELKPSHYAIAFDRKAPTFRHQLFDQYKAHRPETPAELVSQLDRVREMVRAFRMAVFELDGYEADDVLGALSQQASQQGIDTVIVTGDADAMQLVSPRVRVLYPRPGRPFSDTVLYDQAAVIEKYGVPPERIADLKALVGDPSDNIPGVPGVGPKTAVKLISQFGGVDAIYRHLDRVTPARTQALLRENEAIARQCLQLATIVRETPVTLDLEAGRAGRFDRNQVAELFRELGFFSLLARLPEPASEAGGDTAAAVTAAAPPVAYHTVTTTPALDGLLGRLSGAKSFAFDLETTSLDAMSAQLVGISLSPAPGEAYYIPVGHQGLWGAGQLPLEPVLERLKGPLGDAALTKLAHNGNYDTTVLAEYGVSVNRLDFDTMLAAYLTGEKSLGLKALAFGRLGIEMTPITELIGTGAKQVPMSCVEIDRVAGYACADADMTMRLGGLLHDELHRQGLWRLFTEVEMPLVPVLVAMERAGIALDTARLRRMSQQLGEQLIRLEREIYDNVGHQFNINSPKQLGVVLCDELRLPLPRRRGSYSTEAVALEGLRGGPPGHRARPGVPPAEQAEINLR